MPDTYTPQLAWPVRFSCDVSTASPTATGRAVAFATDLLYQLTGQQFGLTQATLRPCRNYHRGTPFPDGWLPWPGTGFTNLVGATWYGGVYGYYVDNLCGSCAGGCGCMGNETAKLPALAHDITQVKINGTVLASSSYRVDGHYLTRTDGYTWPFYNDLRLDDTQPGTWSVTGNFGQNPPVGADIAVGELACEFLKAMRGEDCRLPNNVTQLARQGVSISIDRTSVANAGLTGLYLVDTFIRTWNPNGLRSQPRVYSVEDLLTRRIGT